MTFGIYEIQSFWNLGRAADTRVSGGIKEVDDGYRYNHQTT